MKWQNITCAATGVVKCWAACQGSHGMCSDADGMKAPDSLWGHCTSHYHL